MKAPVRDKVTRDFTSISLYNFSFIFRSFRVNALFSVRFVSLRQIGVWRIVTKRAMGLLAPNPRQVLFVKSTWNLKTFNCCRTPIFSENERRTKRYSQSRRYLTVWGLRPSLTPCGVNERHVTESRENKPMPVCFHGFPSVPHTVKCRGDASLSQKEKSNI
jgi:hypothetical protein